MKKIISSAIAIAMLSSTVAMAATVIAPTPQTTKVAETQTFDDAASKVSEETGKLPYWVNFGKVAAINYSGQKYEVVNNPFDSETETDKVIKLGNDILKDDANNQPTASFTIEDGAFLGGDIVKFSFELALKNASSNSSSNSNIEVTTTYNNETTGTETSDEIIHLYNSGYVASHFSDAQRYEHAFSSTEFKKYTITMNTVTDTMVVEYPKASGTETYTINLADDKKIDSIKKIGLTLRHETGDTGTPEFYINNFSCEVTTLPDEKIEEFDTLQNNTGESWNKNQTLTNAKYRFDGAKVENTQDIETPSNRGNVLKCSGDASSGNYVAMPLNYTMDSDDVFTFSFDYAEEKHNKDGTLAFRLEDYSLDAKRDMGFTFTKASDPSKTYSTTSSCVFTIAEGMVRIAGNWKSQDYNVMSVNEFHTITVVIDNSDEAYPDASGNAQRTLAIYVDGALQSNTKWIMTDNDGKESSNTINGVSLTFNGGWPVETHYFDNLWASLADNDIKVDGNNVSYTYPVVYDDATPAIFVKAYYDSTGRLISADTASATPSTERTVTTTLNKPEGTVKTKVFRWDSLDAIQNLSPAYDSSKTTN